MVSTSVRALLVLAAATALAVGCSSRDPAGEPTAGEVEAGAPTEDGAAEAPSVPAESVDPTEVMMIPARLTVNADTSGAVYIDGRRLSETTPLETAEVSPGRHRVQLAWDDDAVLGDPRPALLRSDGNVMLYVRRDEVVRPPSDPGVVRTEDELAEIDARLTAERAEAAAEGSGEPANDSEGSGDADGTTEGGDDDTAEGTTDGDNADGTTEGGDDDIAEGSGDDTEGGIEGTDDTTADGSGEGAAEAVGTGYLRIDAAEAGTVYVDGHRTELTTPIILERPAGEVGIQLMYASGELSRHVDVAIADQRLRQVRFEGRELVVIR